MTNEHEVTVDKKLLFILYTLVSIIVYFVLNSIIITDKHYYNFLSSQLSSESKMGLGRIFNNSIIINN